MYVERPPSAELAGRVACEWHRTSEHDRTELVVPDACVDLIWGPGGLFVAGPDTGPMPVTMRAGTALVGIRFRPGAVGDFFGVPLADIRDARISLSDLPGGPAVLAKALNTAADRAFTGRAADAQGVPAGSGADAEGALMGEMADVRSALKGRAGDVRGALAGPAADAQGALTHLSADVDGVLADPAVDAEGALAAMRAAVKAGLTGATPTDPAAPAIASALRKGQTVAQVAWTLGFSERQLQRRSLTSFGYAPKTLQRIVRFQRALRLAREGVPLAEVAVTAGYTDQAHLANDVKRLSGVPMSQLI
ncbi:AraC-type DNA-binding protein [Nonomuraea solani]|uniref:AraC-type DNA-binding protein n=1 Tax=Nonomuraea solani TaxID=1144553 RepID=A0A1H6AXB2_9ACTN|nr:helix-turn-helix transcriptional regulator [Nonomuraea solani]SEG52900.1 AraC-type DNA-binding protein [Nonomuraea solani]